MTRPEDKTILVVDDEDDVREYLATVLEDAGFQVMTAGDGNQALDRLREKIPDFISLDLVMPNKSGLRFLRDLRRNQDWAAIPFVVVTAHANDDLGKGDLKDILDSGKPSGPNLYLEKPVKPEQYVRLVFERLGLEVDPKKDEMAQTQLQTELLNLSQNASRQQLEAAIQAIKKKP